MQVLPDSSPLCVERIKLLGVVQGVGMRPTIFHLAQKCSLTGWVKNVGEGVDILACGDADNLAQFKKAILAEAPPLSKIDDIQVRHCQPESDYDFPAQFEIRLSSKASQKLEPTISADAAICRDCLDEINKPEERRFRYPFGNCTHCGPRFSITECLPYDRDHTSMRDFPMCEPCRAEYTNPMDRRFHAQAICCPQCGPLLSLLNAKGEPIASDTDSDEIQTTVRLLKAGAIVAIKGLGGFHLACDASDENAINKLRSRKHRPGKPFALMALNTGQIREYLSVGQAEAELLQSRQAPIVLLGKTGHAYKALPESLAPGQNSLGFMLAYTPLHVLLLQDMGRPLVMTSGNRSGEQQCIDNEEALEKLAGIADYFLIHERRIVQRVDDSVAKAFGDGIQLFRRARGYTPELLAARKDIFDDVDVLALGAEQKNSSCWVKDNRPLLSAYVGDLFHAETWKAWKQGIAHYENSFQLQPKLIAIDKHPGYHASQYGIALAQERGLPVVKVQHHHAHVASCLLENHYPPDDGKVLGIVLDGSGYGDDGSIWGGEFLLADYRSAERCGHFQQVALPGGERAILEPWRNTYAHLYNMGWENVIREFGDLNCVRNLQGKPLALLDSMIEKRLNSPLTSSAGRLFDAVAALLDIGFDGITYEGEAAMCLEALAAKEFEPEATPAYPYGIQSNCIYWQPTWFAILKDLQGRACRARIAARFQQTLATAISDLAARICEQKAVTTVVLSGGVFQNALLYEATYRQLQARDLRILSHHRIPVNDGGIALGQAAIAAQQHSRIQ